MSLNLDIIKQEIDELNNRAIVNRKISRASGIAAIGAGLIGNIGGLALFCTGALIEDKFARDKEKQIETLRRNLP